MEMKNNDKFFYSKSVRSFKEKKLSFYNRTKGSVLEFLIKRKWFVNRFNWEAYIFKNKEWIRKYEIYKEKLNEKNYYYKNINLERICFFEVVEIDNFDTFRRKAISKFGNLNDTFFVKKNELKNKISNVENEFGKISRGNLFYIDYRKRRKSKNDLLDYVSCGYIKTNEAYFILKINVKLSEYALSIFKDIINQKEIHLSRINYNNVIDILKKRSFISSFSMISGIKTNSIRNLISDINYQIKLNITNHFKGFFYNSKNYSILPSIEFYQVEDIKRFEEDLDLKQNFNSDFGKYYSLEDEQIHIYLSDSEKYKNIQIVKQKGHGKRKSNPSNLTNFDNLENDFLIDSLSFPCVFSAILSEQIVILNSLKREIYDQIKTQNSNILHKINPFKNFIENKKYISSKKKLIKILLTVQRFETEFSVRNFHFYSSNYDLTRFITRNKHCENDEANLVFRFLNKFKTRIDTLSERVNKLNEVFKPIEELNSYKTNIFLQLFSLLIGLFAFIFAFEKTKQIIDYLINYFFN